MISNDSNFKVGMYLEAEGVEYDEEFLKNKEYYNYTDKDIEIVYLAPVRIRDISETGQLQIQYLDSDLIFNVDPSWDKIHPCGYWNYIQSESINKENGVSKNIIKFKKSPSKFKQIISFF
jgi:hypothetical protein